MSTYITTRMVWHAPLLPSRQLLVGACIALVTVLVGCGRLTDLTGSPGVLSGVQDPATFKTPAGALQMYWTAVAQFEVAFPQTLLVSGLLTDEFQDGGSPLDRRALTEGVPAGEAAGAYDELQRVRTYATQAAGALAKYAPEAPAALRGHMYALEGYAELLLADLYCSGVPLSHLEFEGDYVYASGSTTQQVYQHAITWFDSALALAGDSARILNLARVGKARALVALGQYAAARQLAAAVSTDYRYQFPLLWDGINENKSCNTSFTGGASQAESCLTTEASESDLEGHTGLPFRSSGDPRTSATLYTSAYTNASIYFPDKYGVPPSTSPVVVASGIEARLIEAEAELQPPAWPSGPWLTTLNALRTDGTFTTAMRRDPQTGDSVGVDTTWNAGAGGVAGLRPLIDPESETARVSLLFAERGYWLFATAIRQGDLRRLVRVYGRRQDQVYPTGAYLGLGAASSALGASYGADVTVPIPASERPNPKFIGCLDRGA